MTLTWYCAGTHLKSSMLPSPNVDQHAVSECQYSARSLTALSSIVRPCQAPVQK
eukprot:CAMPEP_0172738366 /NCGR_PEP_ID=MMETSP1074-20121228/120071_1 /TAXON_ID=2916 /ORGANISM="Ceratium fusus, Strain PA161109" /LENGTH=53 /DNA_ID=CAMNT_0013567993 /DNA_START=227 /DNA_END=388 /DNA_ORIENTATION=+